MGGIQVQGDLVVQDAVGAASVRTKTRVFISYSRKDMAFADKLEAALKERGFEVLIDRQEIYAFEDWWKRIQVLIGGADTIVFVLSPDAVKSDVALKEVTHAASLNKRFAPIVCRQVEDAAVPEALRRLNFIFFDDATKFDASADKLAEALQTDVVWIRDHTKFGEAARAWTAASRPHGLLLRTPALEMAEYWIASRPRVAPAPTAETTDFIVQSRKAALGARRLRRIVIASMFTLLVGIILVLAGWINQATLEDEWRFLTVTSPYARANVRPYVLSTAAERALRPGASFRECAPKQKDTDYCPDMVVIPTGSYGMGGVWYRFPGALSADNATQPQHTVIISKPFAVSKYEITFADWDACVKGGGCNGYTPFDQDWGYGRRPVINVDWSDAQSYVAWLSQVTRKTYRLLSEAEYEYAARAGTKTVYPWGDDIERTFTFLGKPARMTMANCNGCGSAWDNRETAPVGSFLQNDFGLYDMEGNVWEWTQDCFHSNYNGAPTDGSVWLKNNAGDCTTRIMRGGNWSSDPDTLRSVTRGKYPATVRADTVGFRVARTLTP